MEIIDRPIASMVPSADVLGGRPLNGNLLALLTAGVNYTDILAKTPMTILLDCAQAFCSVARSFMFVALARHGIAQAHVRPLSALYRGSVAHIR